LGGSYSYAGALSDNGDLIGDSQTAGSENHAYLFRANTLIDLGTLGGWYSSATDVNKNGWVVGVALKDTAEMHGFVFANGQMTDLGTLGGSYSSASAINSQGEIVGESEDENFVIVPFLWSNGSMVNLNTLLPPDSGWELSTASFINDAGHIVGSGILNGVSTYYLLTRPVAAANSAPVANAGADVTVDCSTGAVLDGHLSADPDGDALSYEWREGSTVLGSGVTLTVSLPLGTHVVTLKVTDTHGATSEDAANVVVKDLTAPVITSVSATPNRIDKKNGKMVPVSLTVVASDNCDRAPVSKIVSITSDDSTTGKPGSKAGQTDWEITGALTANLRAETTNGKSSRVYTLTVQCSDSSGNKSLKTVTVAVRE